MQSETISGNDRGHALSKNESDFRLLVLVFSQACGWCSDVTRSMMCKILIALFRGFMQMGNTPLDIALKKGHHGLDSLL